MSKILTIKQGIERASSYCALREVCADDLRKKLFLWGLDSSDVEYVITELIVQGFLDEGRYACSFVRDKFHINRWGRRKITEALRIKKVSANCIEIGMREIPEEEYKVVLLELLEKKEKQTKEVRPLFRKQKVVNYLLGRGFEAFLVEEVWRERAKEE